MLDLMQKIEEAAAVIRSHWNHQPHAGVILGTGLGGLAKQIEEPVEIPYGDIPHFPRSTAISHKGQLVCGKLSGVPVVAMEGRFHAYEGYSYQAITLPVRVMKALGANLLIVSNACGGLNPLFTAGDVMVIEDHINLMGGNPLVGVNDDRLGPRFPDMSRPYDPELIERAMAVARHENFPCQRGVFSAVLGPNLETRAEYRFLRLIGADAIGMSTIPECLVAVHSSMRVLGLSAITDMCLPDALAPAEMSSILKHAAEAEPKMRKIVLGVLAEERAKLS
jgi:purine-nucleoside phosphorylase